MSIQGRTKVQTRHLAHIPAQVEETTQLYKENRQQCLVFVNLPGGQIEARRLLLQLGLDSASRSSLDSRWNVQWSTRWDIGEEGDGRRRILFQCSCGYDPKARQDKEKQKQGLSLGSSCDRRVPYKFTGCLAHVELTERESDGEISRITGNFNHNESCQSALLERLPAIPLHEHVFEVAIEQLETGANVTAIQKQNREMIEHRKYHGMQNFEPQTANHRYHLLPSDYTSLYRQFSRKNGVDVRQKPEYNIDDWMDRNSPNYNKAIHQAVFHYSARSNAGERFEVCISTSEMDKAAWRYVNHSQLILDGTFGVCTSRLLLFIALGVDENGKGVPVAFFLFSAPTGNQATHAGYNTDILHKLLSRWEVHLSKQGTERFTPYVAITDTDTKERGALLRLWSGIILLLCKFHLRQCWTNHRKTVLRCSSSDFWKDQVRNSLQRLEVQLIATVDHSAATALIVTQRSAFQELLSNPESNGVAQGGMKHLEYLEANWMASALWQSWSGFGRLAAATRLGISLEGVIPTTNHLESFNSILKRKHLASVLRSGHRLRFDSLIHILITRILPAIFSHRKAQENYTKWLTLRFRDATGGQDLIAADKQLKDDYNAQKLTPLCWWSFDAVRDASAQKLLDDGKISFTTERDDSTYLGICKSSGEAGQLGIGRHSLEYIFKIERSGKGSCSCPDFQQRGGACKHLRCARLAIDGWVSEGYDAPFYYPSSRSDAERLRPLCEKSSQAPSPPTTQQPPQIPSATPVTITWDPTAIQALGNDTTIVGDDDEVQQVTPPRSEPPAGVEIGQNLDNSSDASGRDPDGSIAASCSNVIDNEQTAFLSRSVNLAAIASQIQAKVDHEVHRLLPSLHGIGNLLSEGTVIQTAELMEFSTVLALIQQHLSPLSGLCPNDVAASSSSSILHSSIPITEQRSSSQRNSKKRKRKSLLPPSPERRQKRKDSYAPL